MAQSEERPPGKADVHGCSRLGGRAEGGRGEILGSCAGWEEGRRVSIVATFAVGPSSQLAVCARKIHTCMCVLGEKREQGVIPLAAYITIVPFLLVQVYLCIIFVVINVHERCVGFIRL